VQRVLVHPEPDEAREIELDRSQAEVKPRPLVVGERVEAIEQRAIGYQRVGGLRCGRLRVPLVQIGCAKSSARSRPATRRRAALLQSPARTDM